MATSSWRKLQYMKNIKSGWGSLNNIQLKKWLAIIIVGAFILTLIPLYLIGRYDVPSADDYSESSVVKDSLSGHTTIWACTKAVVKSVWNQITHAYLTHQGTFSVWALVSFCPLAFSEKTYWLVPLIFITLFVISVFYLTNKILHKILQMDGLDTVIISALVAFNMVQNIPYPAEGFYWWTGSMMYIGFTSLILLILGVLCEELKSEICKKHRIIFLTIAAFWCGGGNYATAMLLTLVLFFITLYLFIYNRPKAKRCLPVFIAALVAILITALAPGNANRLVREGFTSHISAVEAIFLSFKLAIKCALKWFRVELLVSLIATALICYSSFQGRQLIFRFPLIFSAITFGIYSASFTPTALTYGGTGPGRLMDVNFIALILFLFSNAIYYTGWLCMKGNALPNTGGGGGTNHFHQKQAFIWSWLSLLWLEALCAYIAIKNLAHELLRLLLHVMRWIVQKSIMRSIATD